MKQVGLIFLLWFSFTSAVQAQLGPVELLPEWGQAGWSNPAVMHPSGAHLLLGGFSGLQWEADHSGPAYLDFISADGSVSPMSLLEQMDAVESIGFRTEVPIIALGFRDERRFEFRLRSRLVAEQQFDYDRDLFDLAWRGNGHPDNIGRPIAFSDMGMNAQAYFDHGLSVGAMAKEDRLWLGWGIHLLNGVGAFQTGAFDAVWTTDSVDYSWDLSGGASFTAAGLDLDSIMEGGTIEVPGNGGIPTTLGAGVAFDFGFLWRVTPRLEMEGAVEGRGGIRWLESLSHKEVDPSAFILQGLDVVKEWGELDSLPQDSIAGAFEDWMAGMQDSLSGAFSVQSTPGLAAAFDTRVRETWRLGFRIRPSDAFEISATAYRQFRFGRVQEGGVLGLTYRLRGNVLLHGQAQYHDERWLWGGGLALRGGPLRVTVSARHVPGLLLPLASGNWQAQVGMALELGYAQKKPKRKKNDLGTGKGMWH
jgi:hypothetical protein